MNTTNKSHTDSSNTSCFKPTETQWAELKGKIQSRWSKLNDQDVTSIKNDFSLLGAKVQMTYGIELSGAQKQVDEFKDSIPYLKNGTSNPSVKNAEIPSASKLNSKLEDNSSTSRNDAARSASKNSSHTDVTSQSSNAV